MASTTTRARAWLDWTVLVPAAGVVMLVAGWGRSLPPLVSGVVAVLLGICVMAAVHHAEVIAHRVGEPFGSLVLAVAVTAIEVALIVTLTLSSDKDTSTLARDTVFAAVMISVNGLVGIALMVASLRHRLAEFNPEGTGAALAAVLTITTLCLVVPRFTISRPGPEFSPIQLAFAAVASLAVYLLFLFTQTVRHREFFLPVKTPAGLPEEHQVVDEGRGQVATVALLLAALTAVVGLAKLESKTIESAVAAWGLPQAVVGVLIACVVLAPETLAAAKAAYSDQVQTAFNLAYGSCLACVGLTVPAIALTSVWVDAPLHLGLESRHLVLLTITGFVSVLTVVPGRAKPLQAGLHLTLAAAYIFLTFVP